MRTATRAVPTTNSFVFNVGTGLVPVRTDPNTRTAIKAVPTLQINTIMRRKLAKRKNPRLKDFDYSTPYIYFITTCTINKAAIFTDDLLNHKITDCISSQRQQFGFKIFCYCLMPNHLHLLLTPFDSGTAVSQFIGAFKSASTRLCWKHGLTGKVWQNRYYDHILRKNEDIKTVAEYVLHNPVRKGLVEDWRDYKYCGLLDTIEK